MSYLKYYKKKSNCKQIQFKHTSHHTNEHAEQQVKKK